MKNNRDMIGISLICVMMVSLGLAFDPEKDQRYLPFLIAMAFVTLMFFLVKSSQSNLKRQHKTLLFYFASLAEMLWLGWVGVTFSWPFTLGFMGAVCAAWFLINLVGTYLRQRRVVVRWNTVCCLEDRGRRGGLSERDGTMRGRDKKRYGHHACIWRPLYAAGPSGS